MLIGRWVPGFLACVTAALFVVGVAGADNSVTFPDRVGDGGRSLDITGLQVDEGEGYIWFTVTFAHNPFCTGESGDLDSTIAIDTDQNPDTGSAFYGTEYELSFAAGTSGEGEPQFLRANGWDFKRIDAPVAWGCGPTADAYGVAASDLGLAPDAGFNVVAAVMSAHPDTAPDIRTFNFQPVPGRLPPPLGPDRRAPHVIAFSASGVHGRLVRLSYWALDGRGRTVDTIRVYRGNRLLKTIRRTLGDTNPFDTSHVTWRVPENVRGRLRFSVRSADAAGNASTPTWARLVIH